MQRSGNSRLERPRDLHLTDCDENINNIIAFKSDDDISPSDMNSKKFIDKPTLMKRLTMGLLKINDQESRPLGKFIFLVFLKLFDY
jgi:hypothetical protein